MPFSIVVKDELNFWTKYPEVISSFYPNQARLSEPRFQLRLPKNQTLKIRFKADEVFVKSAVSESA